MKTYTDLYLESPRAFLRKLEEDIRGIEARLARLDRVAVQGVESLLSEYERLSLLVERNAYGLAVPDEWVWGINDSGPRVDNLYAMEVTEDGRPFCWTGPDAVTTFAPLVRRDCVQRLTISYSRPANSDVHRKLIITVDGVVVDHRVGEREITADIAPRERHSLAPTSLQIDTQSTVMPGGGDERQLGIALFGVAMQAVVPMEARNG